MDPWIRKPTKPTQVTTSTSKMTSQNQTLLVSALCESPIEFAKQIIKEDQNLTVPDDSCKFLLIKEEQTTVGDEYNKLCDSLLIEELDVSTDSEDTKIMLRKETKLISPLKQTPKKRNKTTCVYEIRKGSRKGQQCNMPAFSLDKLCSIHKKNDKVNSTKKDEKLAILENKVTYLETKLKELEETVKTLSTIKSGIKLKNCQFLKINKLSKTERYWYVGNRNGRQVTLKSDSKKIVTINLPKALQNSKINNNYYLKYSEEIEMFQWNKENKQAC